MYVFLPEDRTTVSVTVFVSCSSVFSLRSFAHQSCWCRRELGIQSFFTSNAVEDKNTCIVERK